MHTLPPAFARVLFGCDRFDSLSNHAARQACALAKSAMESVMPGTPSDGGVPLPPSQAELASMEKLLTRFVEAGLLVSDRALLAEIIARSGESQPARITVVGIPTCGRVSSLRRAVVSYLRAFRRSNREAVIAVADDATVETTRVATCRVIDDLSSDFDVSISYLDRPERARIADQLSAASGVPKDVVQFALLGDPRWGPTFGAARNALLLHSAGELSMQVDDDTLANVYPAPDSNKVMRLSSADTPEEYWPAKNRPIPQLQSVQDNEDGPRRHTPMDCHEMLLSRAPADCLDAVVTSGGTADLNEISPPLLQRMCRDDARVNVTFLGTVGDSGMQYHVPRMFLGSPSFDRLASGVDGYASGVRTRHLIRAVSAPTLSDSHACMTGNIGLDARSLLPPFMPVLRNEDGLFGCLHSLTSPCSVKGFLPFVVPHEPPDHRPPAQEIDVSEWLARRSNNVLSWLVMETLDGNDADPSLSSIGEMLVSLAETSPGAFRNVVRKAELKTLSSEIRRAETCLADRPDGPPEWKSDVRRFLAAARDRQSGPRNDLLSDLPGRSDERFATFQGLVFRFGGLLTHWREIVNAASVIRARA